MRATHKGGAHAHQEQSPRVLTAAGIGRAMRRHKRRTLAAGVALFLAMPLLTGVGVDAFTLNALGLGCGALLLRRFTDARKRKQAIRATQQAKAERRS